MVFTFFCESFAQQKENLCSGHQKLLECIKQSGYDRLGSSGTRNLPKSAEEFQNQCEVATKIENCLQENDLKSICGDDQKYKQISGSLLYMCEHPHKDGTIYDFQT